MSETTLQTGGGTTLQSPRQEGRWQEGRPDARASHPGVSPSPHPCTGRPGSVTGPSQQAGRKGSPAQGDSDAEATLSRLIREEGTAVERSVSAELALWRHTLAAALGRSGRPPLPTSRPRAGSLHTFHPFLFHDAFPEVPRQAVHALAVADRLLTEQLLFYDRTLDRPAEAYPGILFLAQLAHASALRRLYRLLPPGSPFWRAYFRCHRVAWRNVEQEWLLQSHGLGCDSMTRCLSLARGKTALLKTCTLALAFLAGREQEQAWISRALDHHHAGLVLLDDLEDWKEDFLRGNHSFLLTRVLHRAGLREEVEQRAPVSLDRLARCLYGRGEAAGQLRRAEAFFLRAMNTPEPRPLPLWKALNQRYVERCRTARQAIQTFAKPSRATGVGGLSASAETTRCATAPAAPIEVLTLPDVPPRTAVLAHRVAELYRARFPRFAPCRVTVGTVPPGIEPPPGEACVILPSRPKTHGVAGGPACTPGPPVPRRVRVVLALTVAARRRLHGPGTTLLEQLYTRGLALAVCRTLWPRGNEARRLGMPAAELRWCRNQEPYLWEALGPYLQTPCPPGALPPGLHLAGGPPAGSPSGEGMLLYLGARFHAFVRSRCLSPDPEHGFSRRPSTLSREIRRYLVR